MINKQAYTLITWILVILSPGLKAQSWIQKSDFGGGQRQFAVGTSIGTKGYIGTGNSFGGYQKDFWEWEGDTASATYNTWTRKADFGGIERQYATGFSIGKKVYIGMGNATGGDVKDFWEWDGDTASATYNTWKRMADFGGSTRQNPIGFSIGNKGYIGLGWDGSSMQADFWEWEGDTASPNYNTWIQKANFPALPRYEAVGFSIGTKGYIGTGAGITWMKDFWEWDGDTASATYNTWTRKADLGGTKRTTAVGFSIGTKGYIGTGNDVGWLNDFWEWDQASDTWTRKPDFITARAYSVGFSIGTRGYIGTGGDSTPGFLRKDFWEYCSTCIPLNIPELNNHKSFDIYPNPTCSETTFYFHEEELIKTVEVFSLEGRLIQTIAFNSKMENLPLDLSNYSTGIYLIKLQTDDEVWIKKVVVQK